MSAPGRRRTGAEAIVDVLARWGVTCVFGVPGTQNVELFEALRDSAIRTILATSELGAAFMANGYARASGDLGVLITIPGPGFTYALPGLAEARADSAALLHITGFPAQSPGKRFQLQAIDQDHIAAPLVKQVFAIAEREMVDATVTEAVTLARSGEPGPVLLQVAGTVATESAADQPLGPPAEMVLPLVTEFERLLGAARRPVLFVGQGAAGSAAAIVRIAEQRRVPVLSTPSGRGIVPEDHALNMGFDALRQHVADANALLAAADLVLVLGAKLGHNGTAGFRIELPPDRTVHVDASPDVLNANYAVRLAVRETVENVVELVAASLTESAWTPDELAAWRRRLRVVRPPDLPEPSLRGVRDTAPAAFFAALRRALPRDATVVTDSGLHQIMTRRYYDVLAPRSLIVPSDFQSMGFGIPGAIGAALAARAGRVVALIGDGGLRMTGMEITTAVREQLPLTVIVFNDGQLNQIRQQQLGEYGHAHAVTLGPLDLQGFAEAAGLRYARLEGDVETSLIDALATAGPVLLDVPLGDSVAIQATRAARVARNVVRDALGPRMLAWLKRWRG